MRLLLVAPSYYPDVYGGAERQAAILAQALQKRGVEVALLAPTLRRDLAGDAAASFGTIHRIALAALPARGGRYILSFLGWTVRTAVWIWRRRSRFDLVYVFHGRLHVAGPLIGARLSGLPIFVKPGGGGANADYKALRRKKYLYGTLVAGLKTRWTTGFIAVSREVEQDLAEAGVPAVRVHRLSNGVELAPAERLAAARTQRTGARFVSTCRLVHDKNVDVLVEAVARNPAASLTVIGDGPEERALRGLADRLGAEDRIHFLGARSDVQERLIEHDGFLSASVLEGQSNSLLEAFAAGVIPIAADASGVGELIHDGRTGLLVAQPTADAFAAAIARVLNLTAEARTALGEAAWRQAQSDFAIDAIAERLQRIFDAAAPGRAKAHGQPA